jgi:peptidyl-prolyl cis-trans isomerase C
LREPRALAARVLREPTLHFLLLAGALFVVSSTLGARSRNLVEVDTAELEARIAELERSEGIRLDSAQRRQVREAYVDELILVREALAMGLEDDPRIRDVLVQKMLHVLSADVIQPTDDELAAWHREHAPRYTTAGRLTVDELIVPVEGDLPGTLRRQLDAGVAPRAIESALALRHNVLPEVTAPDLARLFGEETAVRVAGAGEGAWVGPHATVRGQHWFRVTARAAPELLPLARVRDQVRLDWIADQEAERLERRVAELRSRYRVVVGEGGGR